MHVCVRMLECMYVCMYVCMYMARKHQACNRPGRLFCDKACNRIRGLATTIPATSLKTAVLYTEARNKDL